MVVSHFESISFFPPLYFRNQASEYVQNITLYSFYTAHYDNFDPNTEKSGFQELNPRKRRRRISIIDCDRWWSEFFSHTGIIPIDLHFSF